MSSSTTNVASPRYAVAEIRLSSDLTTRSLRYTRATHSAKLSAYGSPVTEYTRPLTFIQALSWGWLLRRRSPSSRDLLLCRCRALLTPDHLLHGAPFTFAAPTLTCIEISAASFDSSFDKTKRYSSAAPVRLSGTSTGTPNTDEFGSAAPLPPTGGAHLRILTRLRSGYADVGPCGHYGDSLPCPACGGKDDIPHLLRDCLA